MTLEERLSDYADTNKLSQKGSLSIVVQLTEMLRSATFPVASEQILTERGGQVANLSGPRLKLILKANGIEKTLTSEGGRTSRGSLQIAKRYVTFINELDAEGLLDLDAVLAFWIKRVHVFLNSKPLKLNTSKGIASSAAISDLIAQAKRRQADSLGSTQVGTIIQHLVAAKLSLSLGRPIESHGASVADLSTNRSGDFEFGDQVVHVTTFASSGLIDKCVSNIATGKSPIIVTLAERLAVAQQTVENAGLSNTIEIWSVQQFISTNVFELNIKIPERHSLLAIVDAYNEIIETVESDPGLRIQY